MIPGEILAGDEPVVLFAGAPTIELTVANTGDRPVQVGSHYHFAEANPALSFDRTAARGHRLAIPAGTSVRFEPGIEQAVPLIPLAGRRVVAGLRGEVAGPVDAAVAGRVDAAVAGEVDDRVDGEVDGTLDGEVDDRVDGEVGGQDDGTVDGEIDGQDDGTVDGEIDDQDDGTVDGEVDDRVDGEIDGTVDGTDRG